MPISELYLPIRDTNGWYSIEVGYPVYSNLYTALHTVIPKLKQYIVVDHSRPVYVEACNIVTKKAFF